VNRRLVGASSLLLVAALGCGKSSRSTPEMMRMQPAAGGSSTGTAGAASAGEPGQLPLDCDGPHPGPKPLIRLGSYEFNHSVAQLFRAAENLKLPAALGEALPAEPAELIGSPQLAALHGWVHETAQRLSEAPAEVTALAGCTPDAPGETACRDHFIATFAARAYRRPLTDEDRSELTDVFADGQDLGGDFGSGVRAVVEVVLQSPDFLYLLELGNGRRKGSAVALSGQESAARLAHFLTGALPDSDLDAATERGELDAATLEAHARRLLNTAAGRERIPYALSELWGLEPRGAESQNDSNELLELRRQSTLRFVEDVAFDGPGTFRALLTEPSVWTNAPLSQFYGWQGVAGDALQKLQLDSRQRAGVLTQPGFLSHTAYREATSPVQRGIIVLKSLLCTDQKPPPPNVSQIPPDPGPAPATMRERLQRATADAVCQDCHHDLNAAGFAFEHYDSLGRFRTTDDGFPIDSSGELRKVDLGGPFADALELEQRLADSPQAQACFVRQWLGRALARRTDASDECTLADARAAFEESQGNIVETLVAVASSDVFRYRLSSELSP
jgi:hypothetical protein